MSLLCSIFSRLEKSENNSFVFPGVAASGVISMLRDLASENRVCVSYVPKKGKGRPQIKGWTVSESPEAEEVVEAEEVGE